MKPYYEEPGITIYHGDCRDILPHLPKVDLVLTDPPWGISWNTNYSRFSRGLHDKQAVMNDDAPFDPSHLLKYPQVMLWGANHFVHHLPSGSWLIWDKRNADGTAFLSDGEIAWWNNGGGIYIKSISGQWHRSTSGGLHPTQKPVGLMRWCIEKVSSATTVLDPYMGSGTTGVACRQLEKNFIGIEIEKRYCDIAIDRLRQEVLPLNNTIIESNEQEQLL